MLGKYVKLPHILRERVDSSIQSAYFLRLLPRLLTSPFLQHAEYRTTYGLGSLPVRLTPRFDVEVLEK